MDQIQDHYITATSRELTLSSPHVQATSLSNSL